MGARVHDASLKRPIVRTMWHTSDMKKFLPLAFLLACAKSAAPPAEPPPPPFTPTAFSVKVSGAGRPVIFIPGLAGHGEVWDGTVAHLGGRVQAHVLTLAGFAGEKPIPPPFLSTVRDQIAAYVKANRLEKPIVIGHSLGGAMCFWLAETIPELGGIIVVDGLPYFPAAANPATTPAEAEAAARQTRDGMSALTGAQFIEGMRAFLSQMITKEADREKVVTRAGQSDPKSVGQAFYELFTNDLRPDLPKIKIPALIIAAGLGPVPRDQLEAAWHAQVDPIPNKRLVFVDGAKHFVMLDQPEKFYALVDEFLAKR